MGARLTDDLLSMLGVHPDCHLVPHSAGRDKNCSFAAEDFRRFGLEPADGGILTENVVAGYAPVLSPHAPVVLFKHSIQAVDARDARRRNGMRHPRWVLEEWMVRRFEARTCRAATIVCAVNAEDAAEVSRRYGPAVPVEIVPIGVDLSHFPTRANDPGGQVIAFFGNLTWGANVDAANWFANEILPKVWKQLPSAQFRIFGPGSDALAFANHDPRIGCLGPSHVPDAMKDATVGVVPVISGTGVRLKLLEMLSLGVPVVTTSLGALGTGCVDRRHALIADDPSSFAEAVIALLRDPDLRRLLKTAGAELVRRHAWRNSYPRILEILEKAATTRRTSCMAAGATAAQEAS